MNVQQKTWSATEGWEHISGTEAALEKSLVLIFGDRYLMEEEQTYERIKEMYPYSDIIMNSSSGDIVGVQVRSEGFSSTAIQFEKSQYRVFQEDISNHPDSYQLGKSLSDSVKGENLKHVFIISDGLMVNGSALAKGLNDNLPKNVVATGGLAGDEARFESTLVGYNGQPTNGKVIAVAFYGKDLAVGYGSVGGWDAFGPSRIVTKSKDNVLYELDGKSALGLYKKYLGEKAKDLPSSALLFPLSMTTKEGEQPLVRTILNVNEEEESMIFAGDLPEGATVKLMKANFDKLIDGAYDAADSSCDLISIEDNVDLAILVSCVGRKLVLDQRVEEEVEAVKEVLGDKAVMTGFYSYGELAPFAGELNCELHNQTMTITVFKEY